MNIKKINNVMKCSLIAFTMLVISACSSGGSESQSGINLTGNWTGTVIVDGVTFQTTATLAQTTLQTLGVTSSNIAGNIRIVGVCIIPFTGGELNFNTNSLLLEPGSSFSLITSVNNSSISGSITSIDDSEEQCGTFSGSISLIRSS